MASVVVPGCSDRSQGMWTVNAGVPAKKTAEPERCLKGKGVHWTDLLIEPPQGIQATVPGDRADAEAVATCLRQESYEPVTVTKGSFNWQPGDPLPTTGR